MKRLALAVPALAVVAGASAAELRAVGFDEAVQATIAQNAAARIADQEIARAEALVVEARASYFPIITATAAYQRLEGDRTVADRLTAAADSFSAALVASVPIVSVKGWAQRRRADDNVGVARASAGDTRRSVALAAGRAYLTVLAEQRIVDVSQRARDTARAHLEFARVRRTGGVGNQIDEARAADELATSEAQLAQALVGLARAREALGVLAGVDGPLDAGGEPTFAAAPGDGAAPDDRRADVVAGRRRLAAAEAARGDDWTDYAPVLGVVGTAFVTAPEVAPTPRVGYQVVLGVTVPLYDGGLRNGQAREREVNEAEAKEALAATVRQARSEVRTGREEVTRAEEARLAAQRSADAAARALELATLAYRAGAATNLEVVDAERRARDASTQSAIAEDALRQAQLDLLAATGMFP